MLRFDAFKPIGKLAVLAAIFLMNSGFAPIFSTRATLPSTLESPEVNFVWDGSHPGFKNKEKFRNGQYADTSDRDLMLILLQEAAATWSNVPGSYLKIAIVEDANIAKLETTDEINSIVTSPTGSLSAAASANPIPNEDLSLINDCDIIMGPERKEIFFVLYALIHEIGHCIGLGHSHDNYKAIMSYSRTPKETTLGADDIAGVIFLYRDPAYGDPEVKEQIPLSCGAVLSRVGKEDIQTYWMLLLPLIFVAVGRTRSRYRQFGGSFSV
jgi:hypothetical protein